MADFDVFARNCPSRQVFSHVTGRWGALVLGRLTVEPQRFGQIRRQVEGISDRMLTQTLRTLVGDGLVARYSAGTNPPRTEYRLTDTGRDIAAAVRNLALAVEAAMPAVERGA
ncbi:Transcriptional regulator, HxlR family OS=Tsukamurella paurometabola (strain ATCC 8368 / DSM/ CCUG 35730 / CIP 100753 / JCM 10117 / KCTC 9821 / NBRC 16120/ NCIMB 702349 / NCTC 13040) OX=521096 GN=Tpau_3263 PE=4 SV=1 [Tsukamurella paurometabola]|uniref:Transcriptional regulator, HxlR family n=1 Tax=Tsukamurella paurometabola (strain ATCC 8368 / DSM 20162 / CCUG 35730 / CIP 100753 / JCM 10117 / KCTC 9821 / NBRC 16120 / NCIMB 702349 / NCTC 13040) TaxID=521096 RepID=D5UVR6_TSUPD|nr:helix-turn-helix domain-containing protein [Tsukamurella paurometabola]ADG79848.1 transcriptional regulator, HxlR family [Tsukamurella paurometabola DSM 20162]SUP37415.1 Uncharacterized HTH-type transcriptional regulator ytcD [Tsukamurella paurometabola]